MKTKKIKQLTIFLLLLPLCIVLFGAGCNEDKDEYSAYEEGYIVGSFIGDEVNAKGQATGNKTERGYCILLKGSENTDTQWHMDFYTFNFPDTLFAFPDEILTSGNDPYNCGPSFFPDSLKYAYKMKFKYQIVDAPDKAQFTTFCFAFEAAFPWENYNQVIVNGTSKN